MLESTVPIGKSSSLKHTSCVSKLTPSIILEISSPSGKKTEERVDRNGTLSRYRCQERVTNTKDLSSLNFMVKS